MNYLTKDGKKYPIIPIKEIVFYETLIGETWASKKDIKQQGYTFDEPRWKLALKEKYNYINSEGTVIATWWDGESEDLWRYSIGNVFKPDDTAGIEAYKQKLLELGK